MLMKVVAILLAAVAVLGWLLYEFLQPRRACCGWIGDAVRGAQDAGAWNWM